MNDTHTHIELITEESSFHQIAMGFYSALLSLSKLNIGVEVKILVFVIFDYY